MMTTRRRMLQQSFCFSAALMMGRKSLADDQAVVPVPGKLHSLAIGDWGWHKDYRAQTAVARGMAAYITDKKIQPQGMLLLGDNFYGPFKDGVKCTRWKEQFSDIYPKQDFPFPFHAILGNHDYDDEPVTKLEAELTYQKVNPSTRWNMPAKWYRLELGPTEKPLATVLALDSNFKNGRMSLTPEERAAQLKWFMTELEKPRTSPWLIVIGHHPLYSNGTHGDNKELIKEWDPLLRQHKVHAYICGHDHDLQHIEFKDHPTSFVISGGGGARLREPVQEYGPFAKAVYGFTHLEIDAQTLVVRHVDANRNLLHSFEKKTDGTWRVI